MNKKQFYNKAKTNRRRAVNSDSFLEALRDLGGDIADSVTHDLGEGLVDEAVDQITNRKAGELKPNQTLDLEETEFKEPPFLAERREKQFRKEFLQLQQRERLLFKESEQKVQLQIRAILDELAKLVEATKTLHTEVEVAAKQAPIEPGVYHLSFFEKLKEAIVLYRKRVEDSASWLAAFNQRAKRRNYYWGQVRKSGTKFMLSQERYMSTQAG